MTLEQLFSASIIDNQGGIALLYYLKVNDVQDFTLDYDSGNPTLDVAASSSWVPLDNRFGFWNLVENSSTSKQGITFKVQLQGEVRYESYEIKEEINALLRHKFIFKAITMNGNTYIIGSPSYPFQLSIKYNQGKKSQGGIFILNFSAILPNISYIRPT